MVFMFFSLWWIFGFEKLTSTEFVRGTYCTEHGLGQHTGMGKPSAKTGVVPAASNKSVTKMILTIVFFMFLSCG